MTSNLDDIKKQLTSFYHRWTVTNPRHNNIIDFLHEKLPHLDYNSWQRRIEIGGAFVNGTRIEQNIPIPIPARIEYFEPKFDIYQPQNCFPSFKQEYILYEDDDLIVFFKPAKLPSVPSRDQKYFSVYAMLQNYAQQKLHFPSRLDNSAQGVMLISKSSRMNKSLQQAFEKKHVDKTYRLLVTGKTQWQKKNVENHIGRSLLHPVLRQVVEEGGKKSQTHFTTLSHTQCQDQDCTVLEAKPITGRTHQIRVHSSHLQHPIVGDYFYGGLDYSQLCLLSYETRIFHPFKEQHMTFTVPTELQPNWAKL